MSTRCIFWLKRKSIFLVNILKYGKIYFFRISIYSVLLVILQSYTQNVSWSMFYYPLMGVNEVKVIFNTEDSISLVGKNKAKGFKQCFLFRWSCFLLWNNSGGTTQVEFWAWLPFFYHKDWVFMGLPNTTGGFGGTVSPLMYVSQRQALKKVHWNLYLKWPQNILKSI